MRNRRILWVSALAVVLATGLGLWLARRLSLYWGGSVEPIPAPGVRATAARRATRPVMKRLPPDLAGVGVAIRLEELTGSLCIMNVISNSPAFQAGLQKGWYVDKIDGKPTMGLPLSDCVERLRGVAGSKVLLELTSPDLQQTNVVELTRRRLLF